MRHRQDNGRFDSPKKPISDQKDDLSKGGSEETKSKLRPKSDGTAAIVIDQRSKEELKHLAEDLAIVSALVDGRMRDLAERG